MNVEALAAVEEWLTRMLRMFGLGEGSPIDSSGERTIGWGTMAVEGESEVDVCLDLSRIAFVGCSRLADILSWTVPAEGNDLDALHANALQVPRQRASLGDERSFCG